MNKPEQYPDMTYQKGCGENILKYPLTQEQLDNLIPCDLVNPMVGKNHGLKIPEDFNLKEAAKEIVKVRLEVANGIYPRWFMEKYWCYDFPMPTHLPKAFEINGLSFDNPAGLADIVHMDDPLDFPLSLKKVFTNPKYGGKANVKKHTNKYKQFIETVVDVNETITDYQKKFIRKCFETKWYFGTPRMEEVTEFGPLATAYKFGSPTHCSIIQGHETLSQAGFLALHHSLDLSPSQIEEGLYASYLWGQFRCLAGVHYGIDGIMSILLVGGFDKYIKKEVKEKYKL